MAADDGRKPARSSANLTVDRFLELHNVLMREEAVAFGEMKSLVGIVTDRQDEIAQSLKTAVILLNPGIVHRVGPGRIYVKIARAFAKIGVTALRFDFSSIGDSPARHDNLQFEKSAIRETRDAMDFLASTRGINSFVLLGGCSGARVALNTAAEDPRVVGALLINFAAEEDEASHANEDFVHRRTRHYYRNYALRSLKSWSRLATGQANYRKIARMLWFEARRRLGFRDNIPAGMPEFTTTLGRVVERGASVTFLCSEGDPRREDLLAAGGQQFQELCATGKVTLEVIPRSDHTFSSLHDQELLLKALLSRVEAATLESHLECASA